VQSPLSPFCLCRLKKGKLRVFVVRLFSFYDGYCCYGDCDDYGEEVLENLTQTVSGSLNAFPQFACRKNLGRNHKVRVLDLNAEG
jgi:hypothetical protein